MSTNFQIGQAYTFNLFAVPVLGSGYVDAVVDAVMNYEMANRDRPIQAIHVAVYPSLPVGTPNDPKQYNYIKITTTAGVSVVLGIPWINDSTVVLTETNTIVATITNVSQADIARINSCLVANGYNAFTLSIS